MTPGDYLDCRHDCHYQRNRFYDRFLAKLKMKKVMDELVSLGLAQHRKVRK